VVAPLEGDACRQPPAGVKGWMDEAGPVACGRLRRADLNQAFAFMTEIAPTAARMVRRPRRPDVCNRVFFAGSTHGCGGAKPRDRLLARSDVVLAD
jgi:pterin-4a-carbinolamine dehydratase